MKASRVAALAALGMIFTAVSVYSVTPAGGFGIVAEASTAGAATGETSEVPRPATDRPGSELSAGTTLRVEGRLGHKVLARGDRGETFLLLEVAGAESAGQARPPVNLAIVVDRSGSMKGGRLRNAIQGALTAASRLADGDVVSVVAFDNKAAVVVPPTPIDASSRGRIRSGIQSITLGGDTCISCGIEEAMAELSRTSGRVNRMIVLSDGEATAGVRDLPGFRSIAQRAAARGASITTIGVDVDYNERVLSAIALDSNGRHHFVADDSGLEAAFDAEARSLTAVVASDAEASVELPPGVELVRVVDRTFRRSGNRLTFPIGALTAGEKQTILVQVRVPADREGPIDVADVDVTYRDHTTGTDAHAGGKLATTVSSSGASELDSVVLARVNRTATADALKEASDLFKQGRVDDARRRLAEQRRALDSVASSAPAKASAGKADQVGKDLAAQLAAVQKTESGFATPPAGAGPSDPFAAPVHQSRKGKEAVKAGAEDEVLMRR